MVARKLAGWLIPAIWALLLLPHSLMALPDPPMVGKLVSVQGEVAVRRGEGSTRWEPAQVGQSLLAGDAVRTGPASRASILCLDESQIKLNENTIVIMKSIAPSPRLQTVVPATEKPAPASHFEVPQGEIWLRNKQEKFRFELETPAVNAIIRGTELNIKVAPDGATSVILLEGNVCLVNPQGEVCLLPGEEGYSIPGQKPGKRVLVRPDDAVQWCLYYPGIFSHRDLPLAALPEELRISAGTPAIAALIRQGEAAYDQGRLDAARQDAETALRQDPENSRALMLLGWISLQKGALEEALGFFRRVKHPDDLSIVGMALCRYRLGEVTGAYEFIRNYCQKPRISPLLATMCGYFSLMAGKVEEARGRLEAVPETAPAGHLARAQLAQIYLVQNRKEAALKEAGAALSRSPNSPGALLSFALVKLASFDLRAATAYLEKALQADPGFIPAYAYLAKIWLGSEYLGRAQKTIDKALRLAPRDPQVLSLAGFIRLAYRDYSEAFQLWNRALQVDPKFGEPHLGLAIYHFRYREFRRGLEEMLTATLLDPRVASYQTELGKALYQARSFGRALEVYDYAKTLDPKDPSPYLYKGIALTDLNRPGEAIQEINKSIELNDNVAMFRSRSLLDQDLAVRNASLARAYQQLGLTEWGFSKAVTAVKYQPYNSSAHLFLRDVIIAGRAGSAAPFLTTGLLLSTRDTESALFRVLSPANQATFSSLQFRGTEALGLTREYAPMFEMPYARMGLSGGVGAAEGSKFRQDHQAVVYGGVPGAAFEAFGQYSEDPLRRPSDQDLSSFKGRDRFSSIEAAAKLEPTVHGTLTGFFEYRDEKQNDQTINTFNTSPAPFRSSNDLNIRSRLYEAAYFHRFNPQSAFLVYFAHKDTPFHQVNRFSDLPPTFLQITGLTSDEEFNNIQVQKHLALSFLGQHTLIGGFDYFSANISQRAQVDFLGFGTVFKADDRPPFWSHSFYLLDYWRPHRNLVLELGLFKTFQKDPLGFPGNVYHSIWSPRFGANVQFGVGNTQHVLRAAVERHLTTHLISQPLLVPAEVASFPWAIDATTGSEVRQAGAAWETQWDSKTFTTLRLNALRVSTPTFLFGDDHPFYLTWKRYQASLVLNRILATSLGLSLGVMGKRLVPDLAFQQEGAPPVIQDFNEIDAFLSLAYLNRQGWLARITPLLVQQFGKITGHQADNPFVIMNLTLGREFPNKWGFALFEVQNLFNRQPFYSLEPRRDIEFPTGRRFLFRLGLYF